MKLTSPVFQHQGGIPSKYTCDGDGVSPPLSISGIPENAKSLALVSDDPDAPVGTFVHWVAWNIPPDTAQIPENHKFQNEGITDFGRKGWGSPCPPSGAHRYFFKLYALDTVLSLPPTARKKDLENAMKGHVLAEAQLVGIYRRL